MKDGMKNFAATLRGVCERPAMYVGYTSVRAVSHYLHGYHHALKDAGHTEPPLMAWQRWVEKRFLISDPAWHWSRILVHEYGSDEDALGAMPGLYSEFEKEYAELGVGGIEAASGQRFREVYGDWPTSRPTPNGSITGEPWFSDPPLRRRPSDGTQRTRD